MPQEREANYPYPTAEDVAAAPGGREAKAARNVVARHITGIPRRAYLMGESDHAPVVRGVADLTTACYKLLDSKTPESSDDALDEIREILEGHGCPATGDA